MIRNNLQQRLTEKQMFLFTSYENRDLRSCYFILINKKSKLKKSQFTAFFSVVKANNYYQNWGKKIKQIQRITYYWRIKL